MFRERKEEKDASIPYSPTNLSMVIHRAFEKIDDETLDDSRDESWQDWRDFWVFFLLQKTLMSIVCTTVHLWCDDHSTSINVCRA